MKFSSHLSIAIANYPRDHVLHKPKSTPFQDATEQITTFLVNWFLIAWFFVWIFSIHSFVKYRPRSGPTWLLNKQIKYHLTNILQVECREIYLQIWSNILYIKITDVRNEQITISLHNATLQNEHSTNAII